MAEKSDRQMGECICNLYNIVDMCVCVCVRQAENGSIANMNLYILAGHDSFIHSFIYYVVREYVCINTHCEVMIL